MKPLKILKTKCETCKYITRYEITLRAKKVEDYLYKEICVYCQPSRKTKLLELIERVNVRNIHWEHKIGAKDGAVDL